MSTNEDTVLSAPVWLAEHHKDDWSATVGSDTAVMADCCPGAAAILKQVNPDQYQMPFGTRVVCIKTQHLDNIHIAMRRGMWITSDRVGEKINRVFEEHDAEGGERVLFIFSINRQRSFCALAEMNGLWAKGGDGIPGWHEAAGGFNIVGTIPITFTHVKNVANEHFSHINHENPNQPITNMWNGMHFEMEKGREVVEIYHVKAHFTNVLCRDKRKSYNPFDPVTNAQVLDPRLCHKFVVPPSNSGRGRGPRPARITTSWRHGGAGDKDEATPTRSPIAKQTNYPVHSDEQTPTPTQERFMKRDHVPSPLRLQAAHGPSQLSPSPLPGQVVQCVVDENGNYVPILPIVALSGSPATHPTTAAQGSGAKGTMRAVVPTQTVPSPLHQSPMQIVPGRGRGKPTMQQSASFENQDWRNKPQPPSSVPDVLAANAEAKSPRLHALDTKTAQEPYCGGKPAQSDATDSLEFVRQAAIKAGRWMPTDAELRAMALAAPDSSALFAEAHANALKKHPHMVTRHARARNEQVLSYETVRRQDSASSTLPSEYKDWASTSEVERQRITPLSPLSGDSKPFVIHSVSKNNSPASKAFTAEVNRELRKLRQGERATPTPTKARSQQFAPTTTGTYDMQSMLNGLPGSGFAQPAASRNNMNGGVPIPPHIAAREPTGAAESMPGLHQPASAEVNQSGDLSPLFGYGQIPRSMIPALVSAGEYGPGVEYPSQLLDASEKFQPGRYSPPSCYTDPSQLYGYQNAQKNHPESSNSDLSFL